MFTAARCHFKWVREGVIVFEGQEDSGGWLSSVCPEHAAHRGTVKYEQVLMNCAADSQFRGPEKLHLRDKKNNRKHHPCSVCLWRPSCQPRTKPSDCCYMFDCPCPPSLLRIDVSFRNERFDFLLRWVPPWLGGMSALVGEDDQLDLYSVTKLLIMVCDLWVLFTSELPSFHGGIKAVPSTICFKRRDLYILTLFFA